MKQKIEMPTSPLDILNNELECRNIKLSDFLKVVKLEQDDINHIDSKIAKKLEKTLGINKAHWLLIQKKYDNDMEYYSYRKNLYKSYIIASTIALVFSATMIGYILIKALS